MRRTACRLAAVALVLGGLLPAATAAAAERYPDRSPWLIGLELGWAKFAMDDVNALIRAFNENPDVDDLGEIKGGVDFGVLVGRRLSPAFTAGLKFTHLDGSSDLPDPTGAFEINTGANIWGGFLHYVPPLDGGMAYGLGADVGVISTTGEVNLLDPRTDTRLDADYDGSALATAAYAIVDFVGTRTVSFQAQLGYRYAKITDATLSGIPAGSIDHSGLFVRASFRLHP